MESNNTKIHFATGVKMLYLFPQIPPRPLPIPWQKVVLQHLFLVSLTVVNGIHTWLVNIYVYMHECVMYMCMCIYICIYVYLYIYIYLYIYVYIYICVCICMCILCICICVCVYVCMCMYINMYRHLFFVRALSLSS